MKRFDIIITTNGAGELSAYVKPTVEEISRSIPEARVTIVFTPCQFATGRELEEAKKLEGIDHIILPKEYVRWVTLNRPPQGLSFGDKGVVLYMGGDLLHAMLLSKKLRFVPLAYSQKNAQWHRFFRSFMVPDENVYNKFVKKGVKKEKLQIVGDLMVDSIPERPDTDRAAVELALDRSRPIISFMPGSRTFQINYMMPFFIGCADIIRKIMPEAQLLFIISPFLVEDDIKHAIRGRGTVCSQEDQKFILTNAGTRIKMIGRLRHETLLISTIAVTIPGTNTAEIGAIGTPMIVVLPLDRPDPIPFEGFIDTIFRIPLIGIPLKKTFCIFLNRVTEYFALPSIRARKMIVPEVRGIISPREVASSVIKHAKDAEWQRRTSLELKAAMGPRGAAKKISEEILRVIGEKT